MMSSGSTKFFLDFDIFSIEPIVAGLPVAISMARRPSPSPSNRISPGSSQAPSARLVGFVRDHALREECRERLTRFVEQWPVVPHGAREKARIEQVENCVLDAADVLIDRQPIVRGVEVNRRLRLRGAVKRTKYQEQSTNVSIVSVSRVAGSPHCGQSTCFHVGCRSSGLPGLSNVASSGSLTGRSFAGTGTTPQSSQWMTGIGQPQ